MPKRLILLESLTTQALAAVQALLESNESFTEKEVECLRELQRFQGLAVLAAVRATSSILARGQARDVFTLVESVTSAERIRA